MPQPDSTNRFTDRVENYVRFRPGYPCEVLQVLATQAGLTSSMVVADVGAGTGISSRLFLENGNTVFAVEPNDAMRAAAEKLLNPLPRFHSVAGTAEQTTLDDTSIDLVVAGQAFHWFRVPEARREFKRILRPAGWVVLLWNTRRTDSTPFLRGYEQLLLDFGTDYREVNHANLSEPTLREFFGSSPRYARLDNVQHFDLAGLTGRLLSSSYVPAADDPRYQPMLAALGQLFATYQEQGQVAFEYDTELYFGTLS